MIEIPYIFWQALVYGVIVYAMIGFEWTVTKFIWYLFFMYFTLLYFTFYGMMTVAVTPNHHIASIVSSAFYGLWNLFSGFVVPRTVSSWLISPHLVSALCALILIVFVYIGNDRGSQYGGDGTIGHAQCHGACMD